MLNRSYAQIEASVVTPAQPDNKGKGKEQDNGTDGDADAGGDGRESEAEDEVSPEALKKHKQGKSRPKPTLDIDQLAKSLLGASKARIEITPAHWARFALFVSPSFGASLVVTDATYTVT